jgi:hypothetical protein
MSSGRDGRARRPEENIMTRITFIKNSLTVVGARAAVEAIKAALWEQARARTAEGETGAVNLQAPEYVAAVAAFSKACNEAGAQWDREFLPAARARACWPARAWPWSLERVGQG